MSRFIISGCGYVGQRLALRLMQDGHAVQCYARSPATVRHLADAGLAAEAWDLDAGARDLDPDAVTAATLCYLTPPPGEGDRDTRLERFLGALAGPPRRFVYMSTTGVYGDCGGARVDESRPPNPQSPRARRRLAAEAALRAWCEGNGTPWVILRVPGIYGPGRLPVARLTDGDVVIRAQDAGPGNRIHVTDLVRVCAAAALEENAGGIYNVGDGNHMSSTEFLERLAEIGGLPVPNTVPVEQARQRMSPRRWSFLAESRRIDNTRMVDELGVSPLYGNPEDGIRASLEEGATPL